MVDPAVGRLEGGGAVLVGAHVTETIKGGIIGHGEWSEAVAAHVDTARIVSGGSVRSGAGSKKSSSRARCTREPLVAAGDGGSGRRSMVENRKARAQSLNDDTLDGDSDVGRGSTIAGKATDGVGQRRGCSIASSRSSLR